MAGAPPVQPGPRWGRVVLLALLIAALVGAVVGLLLVKTSSSSSTSLTLEPADASGSDPFTDSIANAVNDPSAAAQAQFATTRTSFAKDGKTGALLAAATAPGLYGGTGDTKTCNPDQLVAYLAANPDKAQAWADVFDITTNDIPAYVASLTPIVLTSDTRVTNHGYKNGRATAYQAVLEAGTAVLVDTNGIPRVKCNCGNPLTEPTTLSLTTATLNGIQWQTYTPDQVVIVQPNIQITTFVIVNIQTAATYNVTAPPPPQLGTGTSNTTPPDQNGSGGVVVAIDVADLGQNPETRFYATTNPSDPSAWQKVFTAQDTVNGIGFGDGKFVAMGSDGIYASDPTGRTWALVAAAPPTAYLSDVAYGDGRWLASGSSRTSDGTDGDVVYQSTDGITWTQVTTAASTSLGPIAYGNGLWIAPGYSDTAGLSTLYRSTDGITWSPTNAHGAVSGYSDRAGWLSFGDSEHPDTTGNGGIDDLFHAYTWTSADGVTWTEHTTTPRSISVSGGVVYVDGSWYAASWNQQGAGLEGVITSTDGVNWSSAGDLPGGTAADLAAS